MQKPLIVCRLAAVDLYRQSRSRLINVTDALKSLDVLQQMLDANEDMQIFESALERTMREWPATCAIIDGLHLRGHLSAQDIPSLAERAEVLRLLKNTFILAKGETSEDEAIAYLRHAELHASEQEKRNQ